MIGYVRHPIGTLSLRGVNCDSIANYWKVIFQYLVRDQRVQFNVNVWVSMQLWLVSVCACVCVLVRMQLFNIHTHCYWSEVPFVRELSNCSWNQVITLRGKHKLTTSANKRCEPKEKKQASMQYKRIVFDEVETCTVIEQNENLVIKFACFRTASMPIEKKSTIVD